MSKAIEAIREALHRRQCDRQTLKADLDNATDRVTAAARSRDVILRRIHRNDQAIGELLSGLDELDAPE